MFDGQPAAQDAPLMAERMLAAETGGLHYVADGIPGFSRRRVRHGFRYLDTAGKPLQNAAQLQYVDADGVRHSIGSADVNGYLKTITGENYTAKDFRTWSGTVQTVIALKVFGPSQTVTEAKKKIRDAIEIAAKKLGNTLAICRKCYVHPAVLEAYASGAMHALAGKGNGELQALLDGEEAFTLELLQQEFSLPR